MRLTLANRVCAIAYGINRFRAITLAQVNPTEAESIGLPIK